MATLDATAFDRAPTGQLRRNTAHRELSSRGFPFGAPPCRIFRPSPSVTQSGQARSRAWVLEFEPAGHRWIEPLMGWTASDDPFTQVRLRFPTLAAAVDYAERQGLDCRVVEPPVLRRLTKSCQDAIVGPPDPARGSLARAAARPRLPAS